MALDRQEAKAEIQANNVPSVTNATMNVMLQQNILDNVLLRKDEKSTASGAGLSTYTANFANDEQVILTGINQNIAISFSNLEDGDVRYLYVTKGATNIVSFSGANDMIQNRDYINNFATSVLYRVTSKNSLIFVEAVYVPALNNWVDVTPGTNWTGTIKFKIDSINNKLLLFLNISSSAALTNSIIATLPSYAWPKQPTHRKLYPTEKFIGTPTFEVAAISVSGLNGNITLSEPVFSSWPSGDGIEGVAEYYLLETF